MNKIQQGATSQSRKKPNYPYIEQRVVYTTSGSVVNIEPEGGPFEDGSQSTPGIQIISITPQVDGTNYGPFTVTLSDSVTQEEVFAHFRARGSYGDDDYHFYMVDTGQQIGLSDQDDWIHYSVTIDDNVLTVTDQSGNRAPRIYSITWE